jgi:hypothetical protein
MEMTCVSPGTCRRYVSVANASNSNEIVSEIAVQSFLHGRTKYSNSIDSHSFLGIANIYDLYSPSGRFESRLEYKLSLLKDFVIFLSPRRRNRDYIFNTFRQHTGCRSQLHLTISSLVVFWLGCRQDWSHLGNLLFSVYRSWLGLCVFDRWTYWSEVEGSSNNSAYLKTY